MAAVCTHPLTVTRAILLAGQDLSVKPFSLLSTNRALLRTVVLEEDLLMMKDTVR